MRLPATSTPSIYPHESVKTLNSYSHPGSNVTGIVSRQSELVGKRLELLKEALPNASRVAIFWDTSSRRQLEELEPAAPVLGVQLERIELRAPYDFAAAFRAAKRSRAGAVMVLFSPVLIQLRAGVTKSALENRLPTIHQSDSEAVAGGLMSYGPSDTELFQRSAYYIDRLLKGAKVSDLPVEQASKFKLVINLRTAKALGIAIPESVLLRADEVIR
jgi:putative ABC transport system substrate-binding protein